MTKQVAILHYAGPPVVGGVESTIAHHARGLANLGYTVRVITGAGSEFDSRVEVQTHSVLGSRDAQVMSVKTELDCGIVSTTFHQLVKRISDILTTALEGYDVCIVHNAHTLNKNLALTAALYLRNHPRLIAWCHDLAWTNPQYRAELHDGFPWSLLRQNWENTRYVTISEPRRKELSNLIGEPLDQIEVVTPGIDVARFFQWTTNMQFIEDKLNLMDADFLLLLPSRLTRRKNIELALHVVYELRKSNRLNYRLIVSGPPGPHNPTNPGYLGELIEHRNQLGLQNVAHFLYELDDPPLIPDDTTMANLYQISDALLFPSLQEGFGIPILEAAIVGMPIFCSDLPTLHQTGQDDAIYFDPEKNDPEIIATMISTYFTNNPRQRLKTRTRHQYRWDAIIRTQLVPLLEGQ